MNFENSRHQEIWHAVREVLEDLFEGKMEAEKTSGSFYVRYGSTVLEVAVLPYGPEEAIVRVMAYCVQGVDLDEQLLLGLLELNHTTPIGSFSLVDHDIFFSDTLFGCDLDRTALMSSIAAVANIADEYDDRIVARYGGIRALDRMRQVEASTVPAVPG